MILLLLLALVGCQVRKKKDFLILKQNNGRIGSLYSIIFFKPFLSDNQYSMWLLFIKACSLLCSRAISRDAINSAYLIFTIIVPYLKLNLGRNLLS